MRQGSPLTAIRLPVTFFFFIFATPKTEDWLLRLVQFLVHCESALKGVPFLAKKTLLLIAWRFSFQSKCQSPDNTQEFFFLPRLLVFLLSFMKNTSGKIYPVSNHDMYWTKKTHQGILRFFVTLQEVQIVQGARVYEFDLTLFY